MNIPRNISSLWCDNKQNSLLGKTERKFNLKFKLFIYSFFHDFYSRHEKVILRAETKNHLKCYKETLNSNASSFCCCDSSNAIYGIVEKPRKHENDNLLNVKHFCTVLRRVSVVAAAFNFHARQNLLTKIMLQLFSNDKKEAEKLNQGKVFGERLKMFIEN